MILVVTSPKNKRAMGAEQFVHITTGPLIAALYWLFGGLPASAFLFPASQTIMRARWCSAKAVLGVSSLPLNLSSLRPGGATTFYRNSNENVAALQFRGRWASTSTLTHYLQEASAAMMLAKIPPQAAGSVALAVEAFDVLSRTPQRSAARLIGKSAWAWASSPATSRALIDADKARKPDGAMAC